MLAEPALWPKEFCVLIRLESSPSILFVEGEEVLPIGISPESELRYDPEAECPLSWMQKMKIQHNCEKEHNSQCKKTISESEK